MLKSRDLIKKKIERAKAYVHYDYKKIMVMPEIIHYVMPHFSS